MEDIIDSNLEQPKIHNKALLKYVYILSSINILSHTFLIKIKANTSGVDFVEQFFQAAVTMVISFPLISAILAVVFNLIPYKSYTYSQRYSRTFVLVLLSLNVLFTIGYVFIFIMSLTGHYPPKN